MFNELKIKVCGMREPFNIRALCALNPDFIGYIFYPGSKRFIGDSPDPEIFRIPGDSISKVGVFVDETEERVLRAFEKFGLELVQLHGTESPEYCMHLSNRGIPVIKAYSPEKARSSDRIGDYIEQVKFILFDTPSEMFGGTGKKFDWELIKSYSVPFPFILSGGIGPGDAAKIRSIGHDWLYAIDLNSRFEIEPGIKDIRILREFIMSSRT